MCVSSSFHHLFSAKDKTFKSITDQPRRQKTLTEKDKSKRTVKSSRACAPLLSFLASAECMVTHALIKRFSNSIVSMRSEFLHKIHLGGLR